MGVGGAIRRTNIEELECFEDVIDLNSVNFYGQIRGMIQAYGFSPI